MSMVNGLFQATVVAAQTPDQYDHTFDSVEPVKRGRGRPKKDPFAALPKGFKEETLGLTPERLNLLLAEVAKDEMENKRLQKEDQHIAELKEQLKDANAGYKEITAANEAKMRWLKQLVEDKGGK